VPFRIVISTSFQGLFSRSPAWKQPFSRPNWSAVCLVLAFTFSTDNYIEIANEDTMKTKRSIAETHVMSKTASAVGRAPAEVMDVLPWPNGFGFAGGDAWWRRVLNQDDHERLEILIGLALLDKDVCEQLVVKRDPALLATFDLSEQAQNWLKRVQASTLKELASAILSETRSSYLNVACHEAA
jgi:hypothetical protein